MRTIKIKEVTSGVFLIPNHYPTGKQKTGSLNYAVHSIPDDVNNTKALQTIRLCVLPQNRYQIDWSEIKTGGIIQ